MALSSIYSIIAPIETIQAYQTLRKYCNITLEGIIFVVYSAYKSGSIEYKDVPARYVVGNASSIHI